MSGALFAAEPPPPPRPLVDVHVHLGPSDTGELYYPELTGEEYLRLADAAGVERANAFAPYRDSGYRAANAAMLAWAAGTDGRVRAFARLGGPDLPLTHRAPWVLRRKLSMRLRGRPSDVEDPSALAAFAGVKLLPHLDGLPRDAELAEIDRLRLPVVVHAGVHCPPRWIEHTLLGRLRGPVVLAHLGAFPADERLVREAVEVVGRHAHAYLDTSGAWLAGFVSYAAERAPDKLVFGSDAPLAHPGVAWQHVASAVHDPRTLVRIAGDAAEEAGIA